MYEVHTAPTAHVVNEKDNSRLSRYKRLDTKARAFIGLMEKSDVSPDACFLYQYLVVRQGDKGHCFPSQEVMLKRFRWNARRLVRARKELEAKLPEVFTCEIGKGKQATSYYVKKLKDWPESLCYRLWFPSSSNVESLCSSTVELQGAVAASNVEPLHGKVYGEGTNGIERTETKGIPVRCCPQCSQGGASFQVTTGVWVCGEFSQCHKEWEADQACLF